MISPKLRISMSCIAQVVGQNEQPHLGTDAPSVRWPYDIPSTFPLFNASPAGVFGPVTYSVLCISA
jgi:hypothetical protein